MTDTIQKASKPKKEYHVPALEKGLSILEHLAIHGGRTLNQIQAELNISHTTAYSLLKNLESLGYLENNRGVFRPTFKLFSLGMQVQRQNYLGEGFLSELAALRDELGHTVHLCTFIGNSSILLYKMDGSGIIQFRSFVGEMKKLHLSGGGKAVMAYLPENRFQEYLSSLQYVRSERTHATKESLIQSRSFTRKHGYALDDEDGEEGVFCIGVPIFATDGIIYGGLSITMLKNSITMQKCEICKRQTLLTGERLSRKLGYSGPYPPPEYETT